MLQRSPARLSRSAARRIWIRSQRLDTDAPFGTGPAATPAAVQHLGYVQIDTINVIERCHHHILWNRIPDYRREHLHQAQSEDRTVFEYWTHALSYVPTRDLPFFLPEMRRRAREPGSWFSGVKPADVRRVLRRIRDEGPLSIRDIDDDVLVEKDHPWASRKPSKRALQLAFYSGLVTISARTGMLKTYELIDRHFGWDERPRAATEQQVLRYLLDRALTAQGIVSLDSVCHLEARRKPQVRQLIEHRIARRQLVPVVVEDAGGVEHWAAPGTLDVATEGELDRVQILSPFDPLVIQRKRLKLLFDYDHRFEAYVPKEKRLLGYFALPVLMGTEIVAALDLKADRDKRELLLQRWTWMGAESPARRAAIEEALHRFEAFQFQDLQPRA
jgi:uncharacterized protein YcaQ